VPLAELWCAGGTAAHSHELWKKPLTEKDTRALGAPMRRLPLPPSAAVLPWCAGGTAAFSPELWEKPLSAERKRELGTPG